jgi:uncharacterized protein
LGQVIAAGPGRWNLKLCGRHQKLEADTMQGRSPQKQQLVTQGRFEIEDQGHIAFLQYNLTGNVLQLLHTEVPQALQGKGVASELAKSGLDWAREHGKKVDVVCEFVDAYIKRHPDYNDLVLR